VLAPIDLGTVGAALTLSDLFIRCDLEAQRIDQIALSIGVDGELTVVPERLVLRRPALRLEVDDPGDASDRLVSASLEGEVLTGGVLIPLLIEHATGGDWTVRMTANQLAVPSVTDLLALVGDEALTSALPAGLANMPEIFLNALELRFDASSKRISHAAFGFSADAPWLLLDGGDLALHELSAALETEESPAGGGRRVSGRLHGALVIGGALVRAEAEKANATSPWRLGCYLDDTASIGLHSIVACLLPEGTALPEGLPDHECSDVDITIVPELGQLSLRRRVGEGWSFPTAESGVTISELDLVLSPKTGAEQGQEFLITLAGHEPAQVADDLTISDFRLTFQRSASGVWSAAGDATAAVFGRQMDFALESRLGGGETALSFVWHAGTAERLELARFDDGSRVEVSALALSFERGGGASVGIGVAGDAAITVDGLFVLAGSLLLERGPAGNRLSLLTEKPQIGPITLPLHVPAPPRIDLDVGPLRLELGGAAGPTLIGDATLSISPIPDIVARVISAEPLRGSIAIDARQRRVSVSPPLNYGVDFPELALSFGDGARLSLGQPTLKVEAYTLDLKSSPRFGVEIDVGLPRNLNLIFGVGSSGRPSTILFKEHFDLRVEIGDRLQMKALTSPLEPLEFYEKHGRLWSDWDFGTFGVISIQTPEFSFEKGRWAASVGLERLTDTSIPLWVLKSALARSGFPTALLEAVPDAIPLIELDLASPDFHDQLLRMLGPDGVGRLAPEAAAALSQLVEALRQGVERLPARLAEYLTLKIPKSALLDVSATPAGGFSFDLHTHADEDFKVLLPMMLGPLPELVGLSFRKLGFGLRSGGAVAQIRVDGHLDRTDIPSLVFALTSGKGEALSNRLVFRNVYALAGTGLPIAVPIFYDDLGFEYRDLLGLEMQSHWSFPEPDLSLGDAVALVSALLRFLTDREYLLHRGGAPDALPLTFSIGPNFVTLPDYLGGASLGPRARLPTVDVADTAARLFDGLKTGNAGYVIEAVPLRISRGDGTVAWIRVGRHQIAFGPLTLEAAWCITTETEFVEKILTDPEAITMIGAANADGVLTSLPQSPDAAILDRGFVVLLMGRVDLARIFEIRAQFGLALTATGGFEVGVKLIGSAADAVRLEISGRIAVKPPAEQSTTEIEGRLAIAFLDTTILEVEGFIRVVPGESFEIGIAYGLVEAFRIAGTLRVADDGLSIGGEIVWGLSPNETARQATTASVSSQGLRMAFGAQLYGFQTDVVVVRPLRSGPSAELALELPPEFQAAIEREIVAIADTAVSEVEDGLARIEALANQIGELELSIAGVKRWLPALCDSIVTSITTGINSGVDRRWPSRQTPLGRVTVPGKGLAKRDAQAQAEPWKRRLRDLKAAALNADQPNGRTGLKAAIANLLQYKSFSYRRRVLGRTFTFYTRKPIVPKSEANQLRQAIGWIDKLPDVGGAKVEAEAVYRHAVDKGAVLKEVRGAVESGATEGTPIVKRVCATLPLGPLDPVLAMEITVAYRGSDRVLSAEIDLTDPVALSKSVARAFADDLARA
jgi:hypothetical protein